MTDLTKIHGPGQVPDPTCPGCAQMLATAAEDEARGAVRMWDHFSATINLTIAQPQPEYGLVQLNARREKSHELISCDLKVDEFLAAVEKVLPVTVIRDSDLPTGLPIEVAVNGTLVCKVDGNTEWESDPKRLRDVGLYYIAVARNLEVRDAESVAEIDAAEKAVAAEREAWSSWLGSQGLYTDHAHINDVIAALVDAGVEPPAGDPR